MFLRYALFDLDGTLSESAPGITRSVQYALRFLGIDEPDPDSLKSFVGPPLNVEFVRRYHLSPEQTLLAVEKYRERYGKNGLFECEMYPGIPDMLQQCLKAGITLAVASSKPQPYVERILEHFGIRELFTVIAGSDMDEEKNKAGADQKQFIVRKALEELRQAGKEESREAFAASCAMVGDRSFDMDGALANGVCAVGVTFGYGSEEELRLAGARYLAHTAQELAKILCSDLHTEL